MLDVQLANIRLDALVIFVVSIQLQCIATENDVTQQIHVDRDRILSCEKKEISESCNMVGLCIQICSK